MVNLGPITLLEEALSKGVPYDARLKREYFENHEVILLDDPYLIELAKHLKLKILTKIPAESTIVVGLFAPVNLAEFINQQLEMTYEVLDPKTGQIHKKNVEQNSPVIETEAILSVSFKLKNRYTLSFVALDYKGRVLYYDVLEGSSVEDLMSFALQELFGNNELYGDVGYFLNGIWDLINGKKLLRTRYLNKIPDNFCFNKFKTTNPELILHNFTRVLVKTTEIFLTYFLSLFLVGYGILYKTGSAIVLLSKREPLPGYFYWLVGSMVALIIGFKIAQKLNLISTVLFLKSKFI